VTLQDRETSFHGRECSSSEPIHAEVADTHSASQLARDSEPVHDGFDRKKTPGSFSSPSLPK
jgi:hypothetical protein